MNKSKLNRNIYFFCGLGFMLSTFLQLRVFQLASNKYVILPIINGIGCILMFVIAYIYHKQINKDNKN
jgi:putative flippase GtrA